MPSLTLDGLLRVAWPLLAALVALFLLALMARQVKLLDRQLVFFPSKEVAADPGDAGLPFEEVSFQASDGVTLNGWFVPGEGETTLLWFHGNLSTSSSNISVELYRSTRFPSSLKFHSNAVITKSRLKHSPIAMNNGVF